MDLFWFWLKTMITSQPDRGAAWGVQDCFCCWLWRLHPGNNFCLQQLKLDMILYPQVGVGAAIMLQSLIGTIGTLMGCCGNKQAWSSCYGHILLPFGWEGWAGLHFHQFTFFRLVAVSSLTDCWYWLLLLLRWHSQINLCVYLFRSK